MFQLAPFPVIVPWDSFSACAFSPIPIFLLPLNPLISVHPPIRGQTNGDEEKQAAAQRQRVWWGRHQHIRDIIVTIIEQLPLHDTSAARALGCGRFIRPLRPPPVHFDALYYFHARLLSLSKDSSLRQSSSCLSPLVHREPEDFGRSELSSLALRHVCFSINSIVPRRIGWASCSQLGLLPLLLWKGAEKWWRNSRQDRALIVISTIFFFVVVVIVVVIGIGE